MSARDCDPAVTLGGAGTTGRGTPDTAATADTRDHSRAASSDPVRLARTMPATGVETTPASGVPDPARPADIETQAAALLSLPGMHAGRMRALFDAFGSVAGVVEAMNSGVALTVLRGTRDGASIDLLRRWRAAWDPAAAAATVASWGALVTIEGTPGHPIADPLPDRPPVLLTRGSGPLIPGPRVAIVGTRAASPAGLTDARTLGHVLARAGVTVVSGLAIGIDTAAHEGALAGGGPTYGVVATGLDVVYPRRNHVLFERVRANGALVAETWFGVQPEPWRFPVRNRIISALSHIVVVVEATERGGARITAEHALEHGRPVFAVPGSRRNPAAAGCNRLIADGAHPLLDPVDLMLELGIGDGEPVGWQPPDAAGSKADLDPEALRVLTRLRGDPASTDELAADLGLEPTAIAGAIGRLVRAGRAVRKRGLVWPT